MDGKSLNLTEEKLTQLKQLFPEVFSEGKVDFARLKDILGENVVFPNEHYELSWAGKAEARKEIQKQTTNTLIPDPTPSPSPKGDGSIGNIFIEGENLEVLRILQKSYFNKIKMIYIDPPYNTGNDSFVYPDDYAERLDEYNKRTGVTDEEGYLNKQDLWRKNTRENGQFHSVWLSMMYPRLYLARNLLREEGVIFVSIDDNEVNNLRLVMDEVFGEENFIAQLVWEKGRKNDAKLFSVGHEYILVYARSIDSNTIWREEKPGAREILFEYRRLKEIHGNDLLTIQNGVRTFYSSLPKDHLSLKHRRYNRVDANGLWRDDNISWPGGNGPRYDVIHPITKKPCKVPDGGWRFSTADKFYLYEKNGFIEYREDHTEPPMLKRYLNYVSTDFDTDTKRKSTSNVESEDEVNVQVMPSVFYKNAQPTVMRLRSLLNGDYFPNPKDPEILARLISYVTDKGSIVLDFFAGSGTTAQAVLDLNEEDGGNRQFICVQMPELLEEKSEAYKAGYRTIADISKARITKVIEKLQTARSEQLALENKPQVLGFRSYKIAPSNFKNWRGDAEGEELIRQLELLKQSEKEGSLRENMLVELLLKSGLPLTAKVEVVQTSEAPKSGETSEVYIVEDGRLLIFFGSYNKKIRDLIHEKKPQRVVCLDSAFKGKDEDISNFKLELKEAGIELTIL